MRVTVVPARELAPAQIARWSEIQAAAPSLDSPYFTPEYVRTVAEVREGVEVAILEDGAKVIGFFPYERGRGDVGHPVGRSFCDFQGVIAEPGAEWDGLALVRACRLSAWRFDHLLASQEPLRPFHWSEAPSPYVDLTGGFEAYRVAHKQAGSKEIDKILYEARRAERRVGPLRFELHAAGDAAFAAVLRWKSAQLQATRQPDLLALRWVMELLDRIRSTRGDGFSGFVSAVYFGDALAAVHLGMRSRATLHYWLPAYDPELRSYSPGRICILETARAAAELGVRRVDLGKGPEPYKQLVMSGSTPVAVGAVHLRPHVGALWLAEYRAIAWAKRSPLRHVLRRPVQWLRRKKVPMGA